MTDTTMIERVAQAIYESANNLARDSGFEGMVDYDAANPINRETARRHAHAAIKALREATPKMIDAGNHAAVTAAQTSSEWQDAAGVFEEFDSALVWRAMIDSLLKGS